MLTFSFNEKIYDGASAMEIVRALEADADNYPHRGSSIRQFLLWSLQTHCDRLPPRDLDLSDRLEDNELALNYLYLRDEYGVGSLLSHQSDIDGQTLS